MSSCRSLPAVVRRVVSPSIVPAAGLVVLGLLLCSAATTRAQAPPPTVETGLTYTGELVGVPAGGLDQGVRYLDNVDATVTVRSDSLIGWPGLTAFAYGLGNQGGNPSALVGDAQVTSNIEAPLSWRLYEAWLQQEFGRRASLLVGLYDLNAEFDVNPTGSLFLNSSHGIGAAFAASGRNAPSIFPATSLTARLRVRVAPNTYAQAAVLDGVPGNAAEPGGTDILLDESDGVLVAAEVGTYLGAPDRPGDALIDRAAPDEALPQALVDRTAPIDARGKLAVGGWAYSTELREWPTVNVPGTPVERSSGSRGVYALAEGRLLREPGADAQGLSAFGRVGLADATHNRFAGYIGSGIVYTGLLPGRPADRAGLAVAAALNGDAYEAARRRASRPVADAETNVEATYAARVASWLTVIGDVQYVVNPNTDPTIPNALVGAARVVVTL